MTHPLNIVFDDLGIWLLGCMIEFSCLYIPQRHYFISSLWLLRTDEYVNNLHPSFSICFIHGLWPSNTRRFNRSNWISD